jgi:hypothetical protein
MVTVTVFIVGFNLSSIYNDIYYMALISLQFAILFQCAVSSLIAVSVFVPQSFSFLHCQQVCQGRGCGIVINRQISAY